MAIISLNNSKYYQGNLYECANFDSFDNVYCFVRIPHNNHRHLKIAYGHFFNGDNDFIGLREDFNLMHNNIFSTSYYIYPNSYILHDENDKPFVFSDYDTAVNQEENIINSLGYKYIYSRNSTKEDIVNKDEINYYTVCKYKDGTEKKYNIVGVLKSKEIDTINLDSINIAETVTEINLSLIKKLSNLTSITVDSNNSIYNDGDGSNCIIETVTNTLILGCKNTVIPNSVTSIGQYAFSNTDITSLILPNNILTINEFAFYNCKYLSYVNLNNVKSINNYAFATCENLKVINLDNVIELGEGVFSGCINLINLKLNDSINIIKNLTFNNCVSLISINIPNNILTIEDKAFYNCKNIIKLIIPDTVEYIGNNAFYKVNEIVYHGIAEGLRWGALYKNTEDYENIEDSSDEDIEEKISPEINFYNLQMYYNGSKQYIKFVINVSGKLYYSYDKELNIDNYKTCNYINIIGNALYSTNFGKTEVGIYTLNLYFIPNDLLTYNLLSYNNLTFVINKGNQDAPVISSKSTIYPNKSISKLISNNKGYGELIYTNGNIQDSVGIKTTKAYWSGNSNYNKSSYSYEITLEVLKATPIINISNINTYYNSKEQYPIIISNVDGKLYYTYTNVELNSYNYLSESTDYINLKSNIKCVNKLGSVDSGKYNYYLYFVANDYENYNDVCYGNLQFTINKINQKAPKAIGDIVEYPNIAIANAYDGGGQGELIWTNGNTLSEVGTKLTKAKWSGNNNYNESSYSNTVSLIVKGQNTTTTPEPIITTTPSPINNVTILKYSNGKIINDYKTYIDFTNIYLSDLEEIYISEIVKNIYINTSNDVKNNLKKIVIDENNNYYYSNNCNVIIDKNNNKLILGCENSVIPETTNIIGEYAFNNCLIYKCNIPNSVKSIEKYAFNNCINLLAIELNEGLVNIEDYAFYNCNYLHNITIPLTLNYLGKGVFYNCTNLSSIINLENNINLTYINSLEFYNCSSLDTIQLNENIKYIYNKAFYNCINLNNLIIPDTVEYIYYNSFYRVKSIIYKGNLEGYPWGALNK